MADWFIKVEDNIYGPYTDAQLKQYADEKRIIPSSMVSNDRQEHWFPAVRIPGLFPSLSTSAAEDGYVPAEVVPSGPDAIPSQSATGANFVYCELCGLHNDDNNYKCIKCGNLLHEHKTHRPDNTLGGLIPLNNSKALLAYYSGIFSLFACIPLIGFVIGLPLGIMAFIFGLKGRKIAIENPEAKGGIHAWVGIILGLLSFISTTAYLVLFAIAFINKK